MRGNRGRTSLKRRRRQEDPMQEYDRLPPKLRAWLQAAALPWRPKSVRRAYARALEETHDEHRAIEALDRLQANLIAKDASRVW
ncbi:MAG: DUF6525 family protein, partial [Pseudomonadota bacterium]